MRHAVLTFVAAMLGVLVALFAFHFYEKHEAQRAEAAIDAELQAKVAQGRKLAEQTIAEQRAAQAIREALVVASAAKNLVSEYYVANGAMPEKNAQVGLDEPETFRGQSLVSLAVSEGGRIVLTFDETSGVDGGAIELTPDFSGNESMGVQWLCSTHDFVHIARAWPWPGCEYIAPDGKQPSTSQ